MVVSLSMRSYGQVPSLILDWDNETLLLVAWIFQVISNNVPLYHWSRHTQWGVVYDNVFARGRII